MLPEGKYRSWHHQIETDNNRLVMRRLDSDNKPADTVAICSVRKVGKAFYELSSDAGLNLGAFDNISIIREDSKTDDDSTSIVFELPNSSTEWVFEVKCNYKRYRGVAKNKRYELRIRKEPLSSVSRRISFSFRPASYVESTDMAQYFGLLSFVYNLENEYNPESLNGNENCQGLLEYDNTKNLRIIMPAVTDDLAKQYYIRGDYIRLLPDGSLMWRGMVFVRVE